MFCQCYKLKQINGLNNFNLIKATEMNELLKECKELEYIDLSNFNTPNIINMEGIFNGCCKLKEIIGLN